MTVLQHFPQLTQEQRLKIGLSLAHCYRTIYKEKPPRILEGEFEVNDYPDSFTKYALRVFKRFSKRENIVVPEKKKRARITAKPVFERIEQKSKS